MSLLDTIKGAREEAKEAGTLPSAMREAAAAKAKQSEEDVASETTSTGFSRKSAARAKPTREAAGTVRAVGAKPTSEMSKEERKAARAEKRREEDVVYDTAQVILKQQPGYDKARKLWWGLMIAGILSTLASWGVMHYMQSTGTASEALAVLSVVLMVAAYVLIIVAFIYDFRKIRPMRNKANETTKGMSRRRMMKVLEEDAASKAEK
ncbi:MAG: hypothetical protein J6D34_06365 [Atopobiaceae bacterium]|nr:hypothetical protein [Atopobiaceae bacterium]